MAISICLVNVLGNNGSHLELGLSGQAFQDFGQKARKLTRRPAAHISPKGPDVLIDGMNISGVQSGSPLATNVDKLWRGCVCVGDKRVFLFCLQVSISFCLLSSLRCFSTLLSFSV